MRIDQGSPAYKIEEIRSSGLATAWESDFLNSIEFQLELFGSLTPAQDSKLEEILQGTYERAEVET